MFEGGPLRFIPLGVGDAFASRWYSSSIAVEYEGTWLLVDCPHPIRKMMREAAPTSGIELDVDRFSAVLLTHLHADHASGLEGFGYFAHFVLGRKPLVVAHPIVSEHLWGHHLQGGMGRSEMPGSLTAEERQLSDFFELRDLSFEAPVTLGPFRIECRRTMHPIPTTAFRLSAGGRTLGFSADTAFDPELIAWLAKADLVLHETNYGIHTPYEKLAGLPADLRAKMRLIHYPDDFDRAASVIEPLEQGRLYSV
jgi:ribonuclease BN (tRNA processing enzyme)